MPVETAAPVAKPQQLSPNPVRRVATDMLAEWRGRGKFPPGPNDFSLARTHQIAHDPLPLLLAAYEAHGPIFSMRLLHTKVIFMLGPEANNFVTVAQPENFHWRESSFGDLIPLLGDGLLDDRRRLPRPRAGDHDARLPPPPADRLGRGDGRRGRRGDRRSAPRQRRRHLRLDAQPGDADRDAGAARARPRRGGQGRRRGAPLRARARLLRDRLPVAPAARSRARPGASWSLRARCSTRSSSARSSAAAPLPTPSARTSSACCSAPAARRARPSPTARCATRR